MKISVIIKTLNEERNIRSTIEYALQAVSAAGGGEVIIADSASSDRTVEVAAELPVRIVQLSNPKERCCGVGAELGYRIAQGEYLYILDGDMLLESAFLASAVALLDAEPEVAGVGGLIEEVNVANAEFRGRAMNRAAHLQVGTVDRLNGGGLFRRRAIDAVHYFTNRNLHAFEEFELAVRLRDKGWRLLRINMTAVRHYGHTDESFSLLWRRWRARYLWGGGELLREAWGTRYFLQVLKGVRLLRQALLVAVWWIAVIVLLVGLPTSGALSLAVTVVAPFVLASVRRRSIGDGIYVVAFLNLFTAGVVAGLLSSRHAGDPSVPPAMRVFK